MQLLPQTFVSLSPLPIINGICLDRVGIVSSYGFAV